MTERYRWRRNDPQVCKDRCRLVGSPARRHSPCPVRFRTAGRRRVPHQGHRAAAGRAGQSVDRIRSCRRSSGNGRRLAQFSVHRTVSARDAAESRHLDRGRRQPRQQCCRRHRHGQPSAFRIGRLAHRRDRVLARRRHLAARRNAHHDIAVRRRRPDLCRCARIGDRLGHSGRRRCCDPAAGNRHGRPVARRRDHRARDPRFVQGRRRSCLSVAEPGLHHRRRHGRCHQCLCRGPLRRSHRRGPGFNHGGRAQARPRRSGAIDGRAREPHRRNRLARTRCGQRAYRNHRHRQ